MSIHLRPLTWNLDPYSLTLWLRGSLRHNCFMYLVLFSTDLAVSGRNGRPTRTSPFLAGHQERLHLEVIGAEIRSQEDEGSLGGLGKHAKLKSFQWQDMATLNLIWKHMNTEKNMMALTNMPSFPHTTRFGTTTIWSISIISCCLPVASSALEIVLSSHLELSISLVERIKSPLTPEE